MPVEISRRVFLGSLSLPLLLPAAPPDHILVGCQANAWPLKPGDFAGLLDACRQARRLDYVGVECNVRFIEGQFSRAAAARKEMEATGVQYIGAHMSMNQAKSEKFAQTARGVAEVGAQRVVMSGTGLSPTGNFEQAALKAKAAELERIGKICQQNGVRMAYHNHNPEFANHNAEIEGLANNTSAELVDFLMDAGHGYLGGGDPAQFMMLHSARIFGIHVKTFEGQDKQMPLGEGDFGFDALAAAIQTAGWRGWIITEEGGNPRYANSGALAGDRAYIKKVFGA